ncbi:hypothetical protein E3E36_00520 [Thermococcus sp. M36]|uniref:hypothetical protein n=1 Tax=Thermococcus sp. M36 TaxID=1638261 RepID=UPI00143AE361|nr:hypothetical protein [Thermococcus sp. M36]NJE04657.1 hypothetical protein [Thermococcus sp. M36]
MAGKFELRVSPEELGKLRREKGAIAGRVAQLDRLEETLRVLRYRYILERVRELELKLEEMEGHYASLVEFEKTAAEDKVWLMGVREEISRENHELEKVRKLEGGRGLGEEAGAEGKR